MALTAGTGAGISGTAGFTAVISGLSVTGDCYIDLSATINGTTISSITDSSGLTWTYRASAGVTNIVERWYAKYTGGATSINITVNFAGFCAFTTVAAFPIYGADATTPFDSNSSLPNTGASDPRTVSTTAANTLIVGLFRQGGTQNPTAGSGFTQVWGASGVAYTLVEYKIVTSAQSSLSVTDGASGDSNGAIADAYQQASGGGFTIAVNTATETDAAIAIGKRKARAVGIAAEADSAIAIARRKSRIIGIATESNAALPIAASGNKIIAVGTASEIDTAIALIRSKRKLIGLALEADTALTFQRFKRRLVGVATETDTALVITHTGGAGGGLPVLTATDLANIDALILSRVEPLVRAAFNKLITDPVTGLIKLYNDDSATIFKQGDIYEDAAGTIRYRGKGAERRERMI